MPGLEINVILTVMVIMRFYVMKILLLVVLVDTAVLALLVKILPAIQMIILTARQ